MEGYKSPDIIKGGCFRKLEEHGFVKVDTHSLNPQLTGWTFRKDIYSERGYIVVYTGKEAGMNEIALTCEIGSIGSRDDSVNVAATYDNPFSMYRRVPIDRFMEIVCEYPTKEWIERFHAHDVHNTLEVLDGA